MPSMLIRRNTKEKLNPCESSLKIPAADSMANRVRISACTNAGAGRSLAGRGGSPREIEEREKNTVVWYTS